MQRSGTARSCLEPEDEVGDAWDHRAQAVDRVGAAVATHDPYPIRVESLEVNEADDGLVVYDPASDPSTT